MSLVFSSFVFGGYQKYIPYYIYSIWKTHPNSYIKVFTDKALEVNIYKTLKFLKENNIKNFEIIEMKTSLEEYEKYKMRGGGVKTLVRYLVGKEYFDAFDYAYIGDIDILFLPEQMSILDFHTRQLVELHQPFSNKVRLDKDGGITERLTGLHFFKTKEYFDKINPIISRIKTDQSYRDHYLKGLERDENFLYKINKEAFDFDPELLSRAQRPWHGLHLGITRGNKDLDIQTIQENSSLSIEEIINHLREYIQDPIFMEIQKKVFVVELEVILKELSIPYTFSWKYKGYKYRSGVKLRSTKRKLKKYLK
ncbi:hypothetical protein DFR65_1104 [Oceanihabitans sediminis]|uniref:Nucleotide-diphospho-sugar transferase domain-containing protein n=1 Tax=Oceanihabitans sediminis TaxID=1812012 RepID=A0A368P2K3_9FLAO|nr:hypothetical protein [Oceanihabitans sediminis]RBP27162.1 hypothetical protein DFR65_1104 [Oceanihabitans sediminis]RCU57107.1 hypothetical protein DU428_09185 [Oceanihabitans sediminis]